MVILKLKRLKTNIYLTFPDDFPRFLNDIMKENEEKFPKENSIDEKIIPENSNLQRKMHYENDIENSQFDKNIGIGKVLLLI